MSKQKPRASEPARPSSTSSSGSKRKPTPSRNVSQPTSTKAQNSSVPKFYDGPTVPSSKGTQVQAVATPAASRKPDSKKQTVKRKGTSIFGFIALVPFIISLSLLSTVLCPPPSSKPSVFSTFALGSLGFGQSNPPSTLHQTLCYPANVYHKEVLEPYVLPVLHDASAKIEAHPVFQQQVKPALKAYEDACLRLWNGPVKPVVDRIGRGARKFHLTYVQPRLPYIEAKFTELTAPIILRVKALYNQHAAHHVNAAKKHACTAAKQGKAAYRQVAGHPLTAQAGKHAQTAFKLGKEHSHKAYKFSRPHVINAYNVGSHHAQHTVLPRVLQALEHLWQQIVRLFGVANGHAHELYKIHLAEHVDPYLHKAQDTLQPYRIAFHRNVYRPYIAPIVVSFLPPVQQPPKSFWAHISDKLPSMGNAAENRGQKVFADKPKSDKPKAEKPKAEKPKAEKPKAEKPKAEKPKAEKPKAEKPKAEKPKVEAKVHQAKPQEAAPEPTPAEIKTTNVKESRTDEPKSAEPKVDSTTVDIPADVGEPQTATHATTSVSASTLASASAATEPEAQHVDAKADVLASLESLKKKVNFQGMAGFGRVQAAAIKQFDYYTGLLPEVEKIGSENMERDIQRMLSGLDRLYTSSKTLTRAQVEESIRMSEDKVAKMYNQVRAGVQHKRKQVDERVEPAIKQAENELQKLLGADYEAIGKRMSIVDGISSKDWSAYKGLKNDVATWVAKYAAVSEKPSGTQLKDSINKAQSLMSEVLVAFDDRFEGFRTHQLKLKKLALERISAREASEAEAASKPKSAEPKRVSILPVPDNAANAGGEAQAPFIGKSQQQVEDALKQQKVAAKDEL